MSVELIGQINITRANIQLVIRYTISNWTYSLYRNSLYFVRVLGVLQT